MIYIIIILYYIVQVSQRVFIVYIFFLILFKKHTLLINVLRFIIIKFTLLIDKVFIFNNYLTFIVSKCAWYTVVLQLLSFPCVILLLSQFCFATRETVYIYQVDTGCQAAPLPPNIVLLIFTNQCFIFRAE